MKTEWRWFGKRVGDHKEPKSIGCRLLLAAASLDDSVSIVPAQLQMLGVDTKDVVELLQSASPTVLPHEPLLALDPGRVRLWHGCVAVGSQLVKMSLLGAVRSVGHQFASARVVPVLLHGSLVRSMPIPSGCLELVAICLCLWLALGGGSVTGCLEWQNLFGYHLGDHRMVLLRLYDLGESAQNPSESPPCADASPVSAQADKAPGTRKRL